MSEIQTVTREKLVPAKETIFVTPDGKEHTSHYHAQQHLTVCRKIADMNLILDRLFPGKSAAVSVALRDMSFWSRRFEVLTEIDRRINGEPATPPR